MPSWNADQYLQFAEERTQPCRDLAGRVRITAPRRMIDLGCGPGNSTAVLAERWAGAEIVGLDSSAAMIDAARKAMPERRWVVGDIARWAKGNSVEGADGEFDLVFSNAAMQWVGDHAATYPKLMRRVAPGGALAVQVPCNFDAPAHRLMRELASSERWRGRFSRGVREWHVHEAAFYYDVMAPCSARVDLWHTEYIHILPDPAGIVEWYKGTGLRPFLDALGTDEWRGEFLADYTKLIEAAFGRQADGNVLFPFQRLFLIAYRG